MPNSKELYAVGANKFCQFGIGTSKEDIFKYTKIPLNFIHEQQKILQIAPGTIHTLLLLNDSQSLFGAGNNSNGELGLKNQEIILEK